jgi:hypothetical protein
MRVVRTFTVGLGPAHIACTPDHRRAFVTDFRSSDLYMIDLRSGATQRIAFPGDNCFEPHGIDMSEDGRTLYVACAGGAWLYTVDARTLRPGRVVVTAPIVKIGQTGVGTQLTNVSIAGQGQPNIGDVTVGISGSATTDAVTIGQSGVGTQLTNSFINMADAMPVGIGLVYLLMVPLAILFALPLRAMDSDQAAAAWRGVPLAPWGGRLGHWGWWRWFMDIRQPRRPAAVLQERLCAVLTYIAWRLDQPGPPVCVRKRGALAPLLNGAGTPRMASASS